MPYYCYNEKITVWLQQGEKTYRYNLLYHTFKLKLNYLLLKNSTLSLTLVCVQMYVPQWVHGSTVSADSPEFPWQRLGMVPCPGDV